MKEIFRIEDTLTNKISYFHIIAFMVSLPFDRFYGELVLMSFLAHELINLRKSKISNFKWPVLLPAVLFLLTIAGSFYSNEKQQGYGDIEKQLALVIFPLIFSLTSLNLVKYRPRLMKAFAISILATVLYLYFDAFRIISYNHLPLSSLVTTSFINHNFTLPLNLHATYFAMYVTVGAAVFLQLTIGSVKWRERLLYLTGLAILMLAIVQLSSKAVFIAALIVFNIAAFFLLPINKSRLKFVAITILLTLVAIVGLTKSDELQTRYIEGFKEDLTKTSNNINVLEPRMVRWRAAWPVVTQAPVIGHGSGSEISLLKEAYFHNKLFISYLNELNAHNQYISFLIKSGVVGLAVFLFVLAAGFEKRDYIFSSFLIVVAVVSLSENILDVNKGIFFFGFFYPFLMKGGDRYGNKSIRFEPGANAKP